MLKVLVCNFQVKTKLSTLCYLIFAVVESQLHARCYLGYRVRATGRPNLITREIVAHSRADDSYRDIWATGRCITCYTKLNATQGSHFSQVSIILLTIEKEKPITNHSTLTPYFSTLIFLLNLVMNLFIGSKLLSIE